MEKVWWMNRIIFGITWKIMTCSFTWLIPYFLATINRALTSCFHDQLIFPLFLQFIDRWSLKYQETVLNRHHNFSKPKLTSSNLFVFSNRQFKTLIFGAGSSECLALFLDLQFKACNILYFSHCSNPMRKKTKHVIPLSWNSILFLY